MPPVLLEVIDFSPGDIQAIFGSKKIGGLAKNVLWIFTNGNVYSCILDLNLFGMLNGQISIEEFETREAAFGATTAVASYVIDKNKNMQMYITYAIAYAGSAVWSPPDLYCNTYKSDYFECVAHKSVNTKGKSKDKKGKDEMWISLPEAWTLIGVIEGVPPFTYNGNDPATYCFGYPTSVTFGTETSTVSTTKSTYDQTTTMGLKYEHEIEHFGSIGGGLSFANALSNAYETSRTLEGSISFDTYNLLGNDDGLYGWLVFEAPTLSVSLYSRYADAADVGDKNKKLEDVVHISVKDINIVCDSYLLENPDSIEKSKGMKKVNRSIDLTFWQDCPHDGVDLFSKRMNALSVAHGLQSTSSLDFTENSTDVTSSTQTFNLDLSLILGSFSHEYSITQESEHTTTFSKKFSATAAYVDPPKPFPDSYLDSMKIQPFLLKPEDRNTKADWIPDRYKNSNAWLLTWEIIDIECYPLSPHTLKSLLNPTRTHRLLSQALKSQERERSEYEAVDNH